MMPTDSHSGKAIVRNTVFSMSGQIIPLIAGVVTIPVLIKHLGPDRFGVLVLAWAVIGYYSIFDLGLGRALTKLISENIASERKEGVPGIFWAGTSLLFVMGCVGMVLVFAFAPVAVHELLKIPDSLKLESLKSFRILGFSLPAVLLTAGLFGHLAANQRFDLINYIRIPLGVSNFVSPIIVIQFSNDLFSILLVLVLTRIILLVSAFWMCLHVTPELGRLFVFKRETVKQLFGFGMWVTISNIVSPLMLASDRFFIGSIVSMRAVAFYATPYDLLNKVLTIPGSISYVLFPNFSAIDAVDRNKNAALYFRGLKYTYLVFFPFIFFIILFSRELLQLWIGSEYANSSYLVLQILGIGILINGLSLIPYTFLQGVGRPDITGKLHVLELVIYAGILAILVSRYGIVGAAVSFVLRALIDGILLVYFSQKKYPEIKIDHKLSALIIIGSIGIFIASMALISPGAKVAFFISLMTIFSLIAWKKGLEDNVKGTLIRSLKSILS